jgi:hypothetical protein
MPKKITLGVRSTIAATTILTATIIAIVPLLQSTQASVISSTTQASSSGTSHIVGGTIAVSGSNVYAAWWNNKTGDFEVMFRASADNGHTFGPKINLSNSPGVASTDAQVAAEGKNVYIIWWERSGNTAEPFLRISYDNGNTFGQKIMLSNATATSIGSTTSGGSK